MNRKFVILLAALFLATTLGTMLTVAHASGPEVIVIDKVQAKKSAVTFPHKQHQETLECTVCHHSAKAPAEAKSCFECHGKDPNAPDPTVSKQKENPFHIKCAGCHKEQAKGPTKCKECHKP